MVHTVNAVQATRLGADTGTDGWFAVVNGTPATIRALGDVAAVQDSASPAILDGSRSFSLDGHITSWTWTNLADGCLLSRDEVASVSLSEGAYNVRLTVTDTLASSDSTDFSFVVTTGDPVLLPRFESSTRNEGIKDWPYLYNIAVSTGAETTFTGVSGAPAGLILTDNGDGTATLAGEPTESGVFRVTLTAQANGHTASQTWSLTIYDGGLGGTLLDDDFTINTTSSWSYASASSIAPGQPFVRWLATGNGGYAATGVLNARGAHQAATVHPVGGLLQDLRLSGKHQRCHAFDLGHPPFKNHPPNRPRIGWLRHRQRHAVRCIGSGNTHHQRRLSANCSGPRLVGHEFLHMEECRSQ
jgi:hypothetical protein